MKLLQELYLTYSPSRKEKTGIIVKRELKRLEIKFKIRGKAIYTINPHKPLLSAHLDQIRTLNPATKVIYDGDIVRGNGALGCDDKNGLWIVLKTLEKYPDLSFIFSDCEEIGGNQIHEILEWEFKRLKTVPWALVIDRKNDGDIICTGNDYGSIDFEHALHEIGLKYDYKPTFGVFSDADFISDHVSCANVSCGYYNPHTDKDYTVISELYRCLAYVDNIIERLYDIRFDATDKIGYDMCCGHEIKPDWIFCPYCGNEIKYYQDDMKFY